ncbi:MAG: hypothetical protein QM770_07040 [Tepidisphaeraceae bacterium]
MVIYRFRQWIPLNSGVALAAAVAMAALGFVPSGWAVGMPTLGAYLIYWLSFTPHLRLHNFAKHLDLSYGTYLYAFPVQQLVLWKFGAGIGWFGLLCLSLPASLLAATASWYLVERWPLAWARRKPNQHPKVSENPRGAA